MKQQSDNRKVEQALACVHRSTQREPPDEQWMRRVMDEIQTHPLQQPDLQTLIAPIVWRFAALCCSLAAVLVLYFIGHPFSVEQLSLEFLLGDPLLSQSLHILVLISGGAL